MTEVDMNRRVAEGLEKNKLKAIVFGGTGFIGSHVVEQLHLAGHQVTAAVRETSNTSFLESLGSLSFGSIFQIP